MSKIKELSKRLDEAVEQINANNNTLSIGSENSHKRFTMLEGKHANLCDRMDSMEGRVSVMSKNMINHQADHGEALWFWYAVMASVVIVLGMVFGSMVNYHHGQKQVETEAIKAGLVQKMVKPEGSNAMTIWVKPDNSESCK